MLAVLEQYASVLFAEGFVAVCRKGWFQVRRQRENPLIHLKYLRSAACCCKSCSCQILLSCLLGFLGLMVEILLVFQHIRDITDPEHPYSLEQLNVVEEDLITVNDGSGHVR